MAVSQGLKQALAQGDNHYQTLSGIETTRKTEEIASFS